MHREVPEQAEYELLSVQLSSMVFAFIIIVKVINPLAASWRESCKHQNSKAQQRNSTIDRENQVGLLNACQRREYESKNARCE
jgi:hypothetical protein